MTLTPNDMDGLFVDSVGKSFGDRPVVKNVSLRLKRGEVAGLLGPNGAGKTTCFYMITGLIPPDTGSIWLDGEDITAQPMYQRARMGLGYLAQEASIFRGMTVEQNVKAVVELHQTDRSKIAEETNRLLEELRIDHLRNRRRIAIDHGVENPPALIAVGVPRQEQAALQTVTKYAERLRGRSCVGRLDYLGHPGPLPLAKRPFDASTTPHRAVKDPSSALQ
jgi:ABC-type Fe3+/spermidine/putrescine transport system ATPase subunit